MQNLKLLVYIMFSYSGFYMIVSSFLYWILSIGPTLSTGTACTIKTYLKIEVEDIDKLVKLKRRIFISQKWFYLDAKLMKLFNLIICDSFDLGLR